MEEDFSARPPRVLTPEERKARDAARRADAEQAMREHEAAQKAFYANRERLKAERLAREASPGGNGNSEPRAESARSARAAKVGPQANGPRSQPT